MSRKTLNAIEDTMRDFNRLTGRPARRYEPDEDRMGGKANIGYAYCRGLGEQDGNRYSIGVVINHGGGVCGIPGLTYLHADDLLRVLRKKMGDPEWLKLQQFQPPPEPEVDDVDAECSECGEPNDDGEGYDGLCGNCADKASCSGCGGERGEDGYEDLCSDCAEHQIGKMAERGMKANPKPDIQAQCWEQAKHWAEEDCAAEDKAFLARVDAALSEPDNQPPNHAEDQPTE
jgi:hypothetical protein